MGIRGTGLYGIFLAALCLTPHAARAQVVLHVPAGGNLQAALDRAEPGDTITLEPGATFTGNFTLRAKPNPTGQFITIRSAAPDTHLPAPGTRITPAYAARLPKVRSSNTMVGFTVPPGASYYRLQCLEFQANVGGLSDIIRIGSHTETSPASQPHHIVLDRVWVHGDPAVGQKNGIVAHGSSIEVLDSYVSDIMGVGVETHAFISYNGAGPYLLRNNYLEASGINVMFGGADPQNADMIPSDITFERNHVAKNTAWMNPRPDGKYWLVKNLFELKSGRRVVVRGNLFEQNWYGAGDQRGHAILLRTENQSGQCNWCETGDVLVELNVIRRSPAGVSLVGLDYPRTGSPMGTRLHDVVFRHNLFADIDPLVWTVGSSLTNARFAYVDGVDRFTFDHNTVVMQNQLGLMQFSGSYDSLALTYTNNMSAHGTYGMKGDGTAVGSATLAAFAAQPLMLANVVAGGKAGSYPAGNYFPAEAAWQAEFLDYAGGNYRLAPLSIYAAAGTDGLPLGAHIDAIEAALPSPAPAAVEEPEPAPGSCSGGGVE